MKKINYFALLMFFTVSNLFAQFNTNDSLSYSIGLNVAQGLKAQNLEVNPELIKEAIESSLNNSDLTISEIDASNFLNSYFQKRHKLIGEKAKKEGEEYLAKNIEKEGVKVTDSGLQYMVLTEAEGPKPIASNQVKVHYHGTTIDGNVFDSSVDRGQPTTFGLGQVIKGWTEGLQLMSVGSKYRFFIPSELGYGAQGPPKIGPNAVLIFDIELLEIL